MARETQEQKILTLRGSVLGPNPCQNNGEYWKHTGKEMNGIVCYPHSTIKRIIRRTLPSDCSSRLLSVGSKRFAETSERSAPQSLPTLLMDFSRTERGIPEMPNSSDLNFLHFVRTMAFETMRTPREGKELYAATKDQ